MRSNSTLSRVVLCILIHHHKHNISHSIHLTYSLAFKVGTTLSSPIHLHFKWGTTPSSLPKCLNGLGPPMNLINIAIVHSTSTLSKLCVPIQHFQEWCCAFQFITTNTTFHIQFTSPIHLHFKWDHTLITYSLTLQVRTTPSSLPKWFESKLQIHYILLHLKSIS